MANINIGDGWKKYEVLPHFALALGTKFNSNSEVERGFSLMNYIHQNKQRNCLSQDSLNCTLHIKSAVDSKVNRINCITCKTNSSVSHCHCSSVVMTEDLLQSCKKAWSKYSDHLKETAEEKEILSEEMKVKRVLVEKEENAKIEELKTSPAEKLNLPGH